jgi:hypothetical protein
MPPWAGPLTLRTVDGHSTLLITQQAETRTRFTRWFQGMQRWHLQNQFRLARALRGDF